MIRIEWVYAQKSTKFSGVVDSINDLGDYILVRDLE